MCDPFVTSSIVLLQSPPPHHPDRLGTWKVREGDPVYKRGGTDPDSNALACRERLERDTYKNK